MFAAMSKISAALLTLGVFPMVSCSLPEKERKPVPPPSETSTIPWNAPIANQGGGPLGAMPRTPRR